MHPSSHQIPYHLPFAILRRHPACPQTKPDSSVADACVGHHISHEIKLLGTPRTVVVFVVLAIRGGHGVRQCACDVIEAEHSDVLLDHDAGVWRKAGFHLEKRTQKSITLKKSWWEHDCVEGDDLF
jgi:hypothetical protein